MMRSDGYQGGSNLFFFGESSIAMCGFHKCGYPKMDDSDWNILDLKWMMTGGYHHFGSPPNVINQCAVSPELSSEMQHESPSQCTENEDAEYFMAPQKRADDF